MSAQPGKILHPALPWLIMPDLLSCNGPALDVHAFPDLLVNKPVDLRTEPTCHLLSFAGHLLEFGEVRQGVLLPACFGAGSSKPVGRTIFRLCFTGEVEQLV